MLPLAVKFLVALTCFTAVYLTTEAADTCPATTAPCLPGLPGRDGRDGQPGRDGAAGPPGRDGNDGATGPSGRDGRDGNNGVAGPPGRDGRDGLPGISCTAGGNGTQGPPGPQGPTGRQGPTGPPGALNYTEQQQLKEEILAMVREEIRMLNCCSTSCERVATSCKELYQCNPALPSGYYNIRTPQGVERVYCEMDTTNCGDITGGWMRAAYINMTDAYNTCPENLTYTVVSSKRMCRAAHTSGNRCTSVIFPAHQVPYTKVCGRVRGYHYNTNEGFQSGTSADQYYVDGLSVTHGSPRNHIWTFAVGRSKDYRYSTHNCPCALYPGSAPPSFVGESFFCESGRSGQTAARWYLDDPLWDSQGCARGSTCCDRGGPWFTTSQQASDDIEVRWCFHTGTDEDVGVDELEVYVY